MSFSSAARAAANAIVSCHETGKPIGNYSAVAVLPDGAGISYGTHQATHRAGTLYKICKLYCDLADSAVATQLRAYLPKLNTQTTAAINQAAGDNTLKSLLKQAGAEQKMRYAQNRIFERNYLDPAAVACQGSGFTSALSLAVIFDSMIQGGFAIVRDRVTGATGEKNWIAAYVAARRKWLANHSKPIVRKTVYRMETFEKLIASNNWALKVDFTAHSAKVTQTALDFWMSGEAPEAAPIKTNPNAAHDSEIGALHSLNTEGIAEEGDETPTTDAPPTEGSADVKGTI